jgi:PAS domain S-box-containing protein
MDTQREAALHQEIATLRSELNACQARQAEWERNGLTEQSAAREKLRDSEANYRAIVENAREGILIVCGGVRVYCNPRWLEMTGYSAEMYASVPLLSLVHPDDLGPVADTYQHLIKGEAFEPDLEFRLTTRSGASRWIAAKVSRIAWEGQPAGMILAEDITERKLTESALIESQKQYRDLIEQSPIAYELYDPQGLLLCVNAAWERLWAIPSDYGIGRYNILKSEQIKSDGWLPYFERAFAGESVVLPVLEYDASKDPEARGESRSRWLTTVAYPIKDRAGHVRNVVVLHEDVTERKQVEEAYRVLVESSLQAFAIVQAGRIVFANPAAEVLTGYTVRELMDMASPVSTIIHPQDLPLIMKRTAERARDESVPPLAIYRLVQKDGQVRWVESYTTQVEFRGKSASHTVYIDITERKETEQALREREAMLRALLNAPQETVALIDADGVVISINESGARRLGGTPAELIGRNIYAVLSPDVALTRKAHFGQVFQTGEPVQFEDQRGDRHYANSVYPVYDQQGERVKNLAIFATDITERKLAVEALQRHAEELVALQETLLGVTSQRELPVLLQRIVERAADLLHADAGGLYLCDPQQRQCRCEVGYRTPHDYTGTVLKYGEGAAGTVALTGQPLIIDDYRAWSGRATVFDREQPFQALIAMPIVWREQVTGVIHVFRQAANPFTTADQELLGLFAGHAAIAMENARLIDGLNQELTERTRAEEAQRRQNTYLEALQETTLDLISDLDLPSLLGVIVKRAGQLVSTTTGYLDLVEPGMTRLKPMVGLGALNSSLDIPVEPGEGLTGLVWQTGQPMRLDDYDAWAGRKTAYEPGQIGAIIAVPLRTETETLGVFGLAHERNVARTFGDDDVRILGDFARYAVIAIENARLYSAVQKELAERKEAEDRLRETLAQLQRSNSDLEQFAYVASHDLQEPLRMVASYVQLLDMNYRGRLDSDADEFIGYAVEGATRMQQLILDLLEYARVGMRGRRLQAVDATQACQTAIEQLEAAITESDAIVICDPLPAVLADPAHLPLLFRNLIANAIKFRAADPPRIHVSVRQVSEVSGEAPDREVTSVYEFAVRDNGIGIEPQYFERIFIIFQRLNSRDQYSGNGIGLSICKKIVELYGGRTWVESALGQGSTFYFTLPAAR